MAHDRENEGGGPAPHPGARLLLHSGGLFNARVYCVADDAAGACHVEKDFSSSPWLVRNTIGRFLIWREAWILRALRRRTDIVPDGVRRLSPFCLREDFCPGRTLRQLQYDIAPPGVPPEEADLSGALPRAFFETLRAGVAACHRARFVHLDLHNARNIIAGADGHPVLIDWQSALPTVLFLPPLRRALERIDLAGVYKIWERFRPADLSNDERRFLRRSRFVRRHFWIPRLYWPGKGARPSPPSHTSGGGNAPAVLQ